MNARKGDERQKSYNETSLVMSAKREVHQPLMKAVFGSVRLTHDLIIVVCWDIDCLKSIRKKFHIGLGLEMLG
jgi:hypothetical protein